MSFSNFILAYETKSKFLSATHHHFAFQSLAFLRCPTLSLRTAYKSVRQANSTYPPMPYPLTLLTFMHSTSFSYNAFLWSELQLTCHNAPQQRVSQHVQEVIPSSSHSPLHLFLLYQFAHCMISFYVTSPSTGLTIFQFSLITITLQNQPVLGKLVLSIC